jgi:PAS domain S-box-containing protein
VNAHAVGLGDGNFLSFVRDTSEQRKVVEQLNDALQRLSFHIERMPLAYIVWNTDFRVLQWNPAAERIFGYTREEALGKHAYELVVPPDAQPTVDRVWADLLAGDTSSHSINANVRKNGTRLTCEWFSTPLLDLAGRVHGVASMAMDITERALVESRIRDAQKLESLGLLAGGVAHDFNSSLMVILGNTSLLRALKGLPHRALQYLELIEEAGLRASELIKHLLAYARTGRHNPQPTNLNTVINEAMLFVRSSIGKLHEVTLKLTDPLPLVLADRSQVDQIIVNLCLNAMQAMPGGGTIEVTTGRATLTRDCLRNCVPFDAEAGDYVELLVADTGCGMDGETVSRIFDPFFTTKAEGHGLGLAAVLGILRQHRAAACVESQPGNGTRFHVYFPIYRPGAEAKPPAQEPERRRAGALRKRGK